MKGLYAIIDNARTPNRSAVQLALHYLKSGIQILQLRQKNYSYFMKRKAAFEILKLKKYFQFTFIINDNPFLTREVQADGVHLGQDDCDIDSARRILGPSKIIGKSTHSLEQAKASFREEIDYLAVGAIFPSPTKNSRDHPIVGLETLKKIVAISPLPVVAIGGINKSNIDQVLETGVDSVASISAINEL